MKCSVSDTGLKSEVSIIINLVGGTPARAQKNIKNGPKNSKTYW